MPIRNRLILVALLLPLACPAFAIEDTPQNREDQAGRYLKAVPPQSMMADMASKMAQNLPPDQQEEFKQAMTKYLDMAKVTSAIGSAMSKTFSADELQALADFYGSAVGKSAMSKMGDYYAAVMPATMTEIQSALTKAQEEALKAQPPSQPATDQPKEDAVKTPAPSQPAPDQPKDQK